MPPGYSPPEQLGASRTDSRTAIYALAATIYTLLTGAMAEKGFACGGIHDGQTASPSSTRALIVSATVKKCVPTLQASQTLAIW
jgi:hypothetical protein